MTSACFRSQVRSHVGHRSAGHSAAPEPRARVPRAKSRDAESAPGITEGLFAHEGYGYRTGTKPNLIEILTRIDGVTFDEAFEGHLSFDIEGRQIPYIGCAALLQNKLAAGSANDLADAEWLRSHTEDV